MSTKIGKLQFRRRSCSPAHFTPQDDMKNTLYTMMALCKTDFKSTLTPLCARTTASKCMLLTDLNSALSEPDPHSDFFSHEDVRVVSF